jgi:hypothetical protein
MALLSSLALACDCSPPSVKQSVAQADIVFRGSIVRFRESSKAFFGMDWKTSRVAVFRVSRVWKGPVQPTFEMPAVEERAACWGFWRDHLKLGNDLLVYAYAFGDGDEKEYYTSICSRTELAKNSQDFEELGPGEDPKPIQLDEQTRADIGAWIATGFVMLFAAFYFVWFRNRNQT